ncbi:MAG: peptidylprolyl isomerase [Clostridia bacterium]|nr:peptidylprolyl isomerase [Clostridia bacterium]
MENPIIKFTVKDFGEITAELYPDKAPKTVENFLKLVDEGFFSGLIFHRVICGFMIQGGGYNEDFQQKHTAAIKGEFASNGFRQNDIKHTRGVLSMARTMVKDSASSQFFIMHQNAPHLDGEYAAFGMVTKGIEVVDEIAELPTDYQDCPRVNVVIEKVERV